MTWQVGAALNGVIGLCYLIICWVILRGLWRTGQMGSNRLALATAAIFFTCGVHHGGHAVHVLLPAIGIDQVHGLAMRRAFTWQMDAWDVVGAGVAIFYLSLRRSYGRLLQGPEMYENQLRRRYQQQVEQERTALAEAQRLAHVGSWEWDIGTGQVTWSEELYRIAGRPLSYQPTVDGYLDLIHPDDRALTDHRLDEARAGEADETEHRIVRNDGEMRVVRARRHGRFDEAGKLTHLVGTIQDITEQKVIQDELEAVNARFQAVLDHSPTAIFMRDEQERWVMANRRTAERLGRFPEELMGRSPQEILPAEVAAELQDHDRQVMAAGASAEFEEHLPDPEDPTRTRSYLSVKFPVQDKGGNRLGVGGVSLDITERVAIEQALRVAEEQLRVTIEHAPVGVALVELGESSRGWLLSANEAFCGLVGHAESALQQMSVTSIVHPEDGPLVARDLVLLATDDQARSELEVRFMAQNGQTVWVLLRAAAVPDGAGRGRYAVLQALDIGERKRFEGQLQYLADHDALTGLFNRRRFEEELVRSVAHANRYESRGAMLLIDLDGFKYVNDTLGHSYGDELITRVAGILQACLRATDVPARLGGDEFAVILPEADLEQARVVCGKILEALQSRALALSENRHARVTASIGITTFDAESGLTAEELIVEADIAMYEAKERGKNRSVAYVRGSDHRAGLIARQSWLERLRTALAEDHFELMAQPVVGICGDEVERYELLLRLRGDDGELVPPGTFLYIAERFDLIQEIDRWVFNQAVGLLDACQRAGRDISLSVNMSAKTLTDPDLIDDIREIVEATPVRDRRLIVEVTETAAIVNIDRARQVARALREMGCQFALDDFGAGFASFYYLKHLEFDYLKIDGEFIKAVNHNLTDQLVVRSVVQIAQGLGAETIAEFVGDEVSVKRLRELQVDYGQGYHLGHPIPVREAIPVLA